MLRIVLNNKLAHCLPFTKFLEWRSDHSFLADYTMSADTNIRQISTDYTVCHYDTLKE